MSHVRRKPSQEQKTVRKKGQRKKRILGIFLTLIFFVSILISFILILTPMF